MSPLRSVELHCHLDGSVRLTTIAELARQQGISLARPVEQLATVGPGRRSLVHYISAIDVALEVLQTPEALSRAATELVQDWHADGVVHGEVRFAPELHTRRGLPVREVIDAVATGLQNGSRATGVSTSLILSCMRPSDPKRTWQVVEEAAVHHAVVGIDIAGPELGVPLLPHAPAFRSGKAAGLRITVHAGEADGARRVWEAVDELGAERIGHGVRSSTDPALVKRLAEDRITLELCPTSNVQTGAVPSTHQHPVERFRMAGVPVSISTDARTVSQVTLRSEFELLEREFGWTARTWADTQLSALSAAFLDEARRTRLASRMHTD
ncbi:adenosine deaminase [Lysobacter korlensis]|uniref:adenosine deaminase n=1 Tax=Lysobacter korlensis TaxID=553636 RepID=A0ABV6S081_9GAMM